MVRPVTDQRPTDDETVDVVVIGAGPCGLAAAIAIERAGLRALICEAGCVVNAITHYPTYASFFSTAEKLSLGGLPFLINEAKPSRRDALTYYRGVVSHFGLGVRQNTTVTGVEGQRGDFVVHIETRGVAKRLRCSAVVVATGYWGSPNLLGVEGEGLPHVSHVYREGHVGFQQRVVVVGGGNSAAEAALDLWRCGAQVTLVHFGPTFDKKIKPWILPDLTNRIAEGSVATRWEARVRRIDERHVVTTGSESETPLPADLVFLLTGFAPNVSLLQQVGVSIDPETGIPTHNSDTLETSVPGIYIAGVVTAGYDANKVFIENGRFHGDKIAASLVGGPPPETPRVSRDLDS